MQHEPISKQQIKELLQKDNPVVLEIGSSFGIDTKQFLDTFKDIEIYCFEPDYRAIPIFKKRINDPRCKLFEIAISDKDGEAILHLSEGRDWFQSSTIKKPVKHITKYPHCSFIKDIIVKTIRLDTWIEENKIKNIDFIWADVEGSERELIQGGANTLNKTKYFYIEFSNERLFENQPTLDEILAMLPNFELIEIYANNALLKNTKR